VLGACALVLAPTLAYRVGVDQGVFAYMGDALLQGKWPYIATWEADYPGLVFLQALEIFLFGKSIVMFRLFDLLFQLGNAYFIFRISDRLSGRVAGTVAAVLYCLIYQGYGPWNTAQREGFAMLFVLSGFWTYLTAERRPPWVTAALIGLGMGLAITIKPTVLALSLFYLPLAGGLRSSRGIGLAVLAGAFLVAPTLLVIAIYWSMGGLTQMYEALVSYQPIYTARLRGDEPLLWHWIHKLGRLGRNAVVLPVIYFPFLFAGTMRRERLMVWLALAGSVYSVFVQGTYAGYHYLPGMAAGAILVGDLFVTLTAWMTRRFGLPETVGPVRTPMMIALVILAIALPVYARPVALQDFATLQFLKPPRPLEFRNRTVFDFTESYDVAAYLRDHTTSDQPVQVWGYESLVYYLADRPAASRFQMTHPLVMRVPGQDITPMQRRWRAEFVSDIERRQPAYVAVVRDDNWWWSPDEKTSEALLDDFPEWKAVISRDYALETTIGRFLIYRRAAATRW
jgi:hypothetical protein